MTKKIKEEEVWKRLFLDGEETKYQVSNLGRVKNDKQFISQHIKNGYYNLSINLLSTKKYCSVHRLVAICFLDKPSVDHINRDKLNNNVENLRWATSSEQNSNKSQINNNGGGRSVWRIDKDTGERLENYKSVVEAGKWAFENKYTTSMKSAAVIISNCANKKRELAYDFMWYYDEKIIEGEIWKEIPSIFIDDIKDFFASNFGRIRNSSGEISNAFNEKNKTENYVFIRIFKKNYAVHRLIAQTFLDNPENKEIVNHKNGIKNDNRLENLEFVTRSENSIHAVQTGLIKYCKKVIQYSITGEKINEFDSIAQASRETKISASHICNCCKGRKISGEYIWTYEKIKII